jgi:hypothetical protein
MYEFLTGIMNHAECEADLRLAYDGRCGQRPGRAKWTKHSHLGHAYTSTRIGVSMQGTYEVQNLKAGNGRAKTINAIV